MLTNLPSPSPVYRLRATERLDARGEPVRDWQHPDRRVIPGAQIQQDTTGATERGSEITLSVAKTLLVRDGYDLTAGDRVEYLGKVYHLDGEPERVPLLSGGRHLEARLTAVTVQ